MHTLSPSHWAFSRELYLRTAELERIRNAAYAVFFHRPSLHFALLVLHLHGSLSKTLKHLQLSALPSIDRAVREKHGEKFLWNIEKELLNELKIKPE